MVAAGASSVRVGDGLRPVRKWIEKGDLPKTVEDLESMAKRSAERFRAFNRATREANEETPSEGAAAKP